MAEIEYLIRGRWGRVSLGEKGGQRGRVEAAAACAQINNAPKIVSCGKLQVAAETSCQNKRRRARKREGGMEQETAEQNEAERERERKLVV